MFKEYNDDLSRAHSSHLDRQRVSFFGSRILWVEFSASLASTSSGIAGNIGFVMFTCIGADPRDFVLEACTFMKQKDPKLAAGLDICWRLYHVVELGWVEVAIYLA